MIHFRKEHLNFVQQIIDLKSTYDDVKALNDINNINFLLNNACPTKEFVDTARNFDRKINEDYPEIAEMHRIASEMANVLGIHNDEFISDFDAVIQKLNGDIYGICAAVLLKHGRISCIKDFIESVD